MKLNFFKYQGTGNDFVMIDNRHESFDKKNIKQISFLCDRRLGIGADGLILLENHDTLDFKMTYYNADGRQSSMCGNGGRCITAFANYLGVVSDKATFEAIDGIHHSIIEDNVVRLEMQNVSQIESSGTHVFLDTGSPHHVQMESELQTMDVKMSGSKIRYGELYKNEGCNINFVSKINDAGFAVRTYERGVEDETLSCGTGVTAVALAMHYIGATEKNVVTLNTKGGELQVTFDACDGSYSNIWLIGPTEQVYKGEIQW
ncbi:diaminopimelate epimerase [Flavobacteriales bacterium 34_180_T64]|nr:diaminopimelate epimerase [Flavobacteriales bacterium 34_180_T64]